MNSKKFIRLTNSFQPELPAGIGGAEMRSCFNDRAPKTPVEWKIDRPTKNGDYIVVYKSRESDRIYVQLDWYINPLGFGFEEFCICDLIAWAELPKNKRR